MNSKKAITLLLIATMILASLPVISVNAIAITSITYDLYDPLPLETYYGDTIVVQGDGATPGQIVNVYWDSISAWDGEKGLLNSTTAEGNGVWEIWFDVPEAVNGMHYVSVENERNGETVTATLDPIPVGASIDLSPSSGLENNEVTIEGNGFGDEVEITSVDFDLVPVSTSPSAPETDNVGSWSATFDVPDGLAYGVYSVDVEDDDGNTATADFTVGASITLNKDEGPSGTVVRITGKGFTEDALIGEGIIEYNGIPCGIITENSVVRGNGEFTCEIVIPDAGDTDEFQVYVEEVGGAGLWAEADFEQTGRPSIKVDPEYGPVGSTVVVRGYNFTQINGETVELALDGIGIQETETDSNGEFEKAYRIPGASGTPDLTATQADFSLDASQQFRVGFISVVIFPQEVTAGNIVTVTGSGFDDAQTCNATLDGKLWFEDAAISVDGVISEQAYVPSMEAGTYDLVVTESDSGISVIVQLEVSENTYVELSPMAAPAGYGVDIEGYNFAESPGVTNLDFVLYNDTFEWDILVEYDGIPVGLDQDPDWDTGYFEGNFTLPDAEDLSIGSYWFNITDDEGMYAHVMFDVVEKTVDIEPRKTTFRIGETLGFDVESSFKQKGSYIEVYDPNGALYWTTDSFVNDVWVHVGTIERVPYYSQVAGGNPMVFLEDAPLGDWDWTWYDGTDDNDELDSGVFTLEASQANVLGEEVADLNNKLTDLSSQVDAVSSEFDSVKSDIADVAAIAEQAVQAAQQAADAVETVAQTANQANTAAENAATAAEAARDAANGLTTLVYGAIGAALVAALAAIVSLMQINSKVVGA
jgi:hypothetical protein